MKKILVLLMVALLSFVLLSCGKTEEPQQQGGGTEEKVTFTVAFNVDGARYKSFKVEKNQTLKENVDDPIKEGFSFLGWFLGEEKVDVATYVVTKAVTFEAKFEEIVINQDLEVRATKEENKEYYLVIGWWEVKDPEKPEKKTSYLTDDIVRVFYQNVINYLKKAGATDEQIGLIQVRNYDTAKVAEMGQLVLADGDVDLMIGVGNNVNSDGGLTLYEGSNDNKFSTNMSVDAEGKAVSRYVALLAEPRAIAINVFDWLKTEKGKQVYSKILEDSEIEVVPARSNEIDLTVTVHGDEDKVTELKDADTIVDLGTITVPENKQFIGFATSEGSSEVKLNVALNAELKYADLKSIVEVGAKTLDLYPVFKEIEAVERTHFAKIGWYNKPATSGLDETIIAQIENGLREYLLGQGIATDVVSSVLFMPFTGNVSESTTSINDEKDIDIMLGWKDSGNVPAASILEQINDVAMGAKDDRRLHRLSDDEGVQLVFDFLKSEAGLALFLEHLEYKLIIHGDTIEQTDIINRKTVIMVPTISVPTNKEFLGFALTEDGEKAIDFVLGTDFTYSLVSALFSEENKEVNLYPVFGDLEVEPQDGFLAEETPGREKYVVIAWYAKTSTSGLDETILTNFENALKAYLKEHGVSDERIATIVIKPYSGNVGPATQEILDDGGADIMLGFGSADNITTTGFIPADSILESVGSVPMGGKTRYIHRFSNDNEVLNVFAFIQSEAGLASLATPQE